MKDIFERVNEINEVLGLHQRKARLEVSLIFWVALLFFACAIVLYVVKFGARKLGFSERSRQASRKLTYSR